MNSLNHTFLELITGNPHDSIDEIVAGSNLGLFKGLKKRLGTPVSRHCRMTYTNLSTTEIQYILLGDMRETIENMRKVH